MSQKEEKERTVVKINQKEIQKASQKMIQKEKEKQNRKGSPVNTSILKMVVDMDNYAKPTTVC